MSKTDDEDFAALFQASIAGTRPNRGRLAKGQVVEGTVVQIGDEQVFVDVGTRAEAWIDRRELQDEDGAMRVSPGDRVRATVAETGDRPRLVIALGRGKADVQEILLAREAGLPVVGTITKAVKGGVEVDVNGVRAFCPASQVDRTYIQDLATLEGQTFAFRVIEVRDGGRSIVLSRRALLDAEREAAIAETIQRLEVGAEVDGTIRSLQSYGAFVDLGGVEGLIHVSELGHGRVASPSDVVSVGEQVRVRILSIEEAPNEKGGVDRRIKLSMKALQPAPERSERATAGGGREIEVLDGTVVKVEPFGVFVQTEKGQGLVPTRELGLKPGSDVKRAFPAGKAVRVVLLDGDTDGKLRFSMRSVEDAEARANYRAFAREGSDKGKSGKGGLGTLGALLEAHLGGRTSAPPSGTGRSASGSTPEAKPTRKPIGR